MQQSNSTASNHTRGAVAPSVVLGLCMLVGVPSNAVVIWALLTKLRRVTFTVKLMLNLAITDLLTLITLPFWIYALLATWVFGSGPCKFLSYIIYCSMYTSVLSVTLMSVQRSIMVLYPQAKLWLRRRGENAVLLGIWALASLFASPTIKVRDVVEDSDLQKMCLPRTYSSDSERVVLLLLETLLGFVIPYSILTTSYICLTRRVKQTTFASSMRLEKLITWIVMMFFVFWLPYHIFNLLYVYTTLKKVSTEGTSLVGKVLEVGTNIAGSLALVNSCLNPFLYAFATHSIRRDIRSRRFLQRFRLVCSSKGGDTLTQDSQNRAQATGLCVQASCQPEQDSCAPR
nr:PREDICTED: leukotriene B4 receptor 1-like [Lepisosteus oculatus]